MKKKHAKSIIKLLASNNMTLNMIELNNVVRHDNLKRSYDKMIEGLQAICSNQKTLLNELTKIADSITIQTHLTTTVTNQTDFYNGIKEETDNSNSQSEQNQDYPTTETVGPEPTPDGV